MNSIGLGTCNLEYYRNKEFNFKTFLKYAIVDVGYRMIDTASTYYNEDLIGEVLEDIFNDNNLNTIVDYDDIMRIINNILDKKINFLEILGELIVKDILKNKKITAIELEIEKLDILKKGASVGFQISKRKK